jgi:hypothetical protein
MSRVIPKARESGTIPPFSTGVRGHCRDIPPRFLPARAHRPGVVVSDTLWAVAIGTCCRSPKDTQAAAAPMQALQKAQALSGSHPSTLLCCLCTGDRGSKATALSSSTPDDSFDTRPPPSRRHLASLLSGSRLSLWGLAGARQYHVQRSSQWRSLATALLQSMSRGFS